MPTLEEIRESIEMRIADAQTEIASLKAARGALRNNRVTTRRARTHRPAAKAPAPARPKAPTPAETTRPPKTGDPAAAQAVAALPTAPSTTPAVSAVRTPQARPPKPSAKRRKPVAVLLADKLEAMLRDAEDGLSALAIANAANARHAQVRQLLAERESTGQIRRTGTGRGTRWRLVTDEERIAARVAELERASTTKS